MYFEILFVNWKAIYFWKPNRKLFIYFNAPFFFWKSECKNDFPVISNAVSFDMCKQTGISIPEFDHSLIFRSKCIHTTVKY